MSNCPRAERAETFSRFLRFRKRDRRTVARFDYFPNARGGIFKESKRKVSIKSPNLHKGAAPTWARKQCIFLCRNILFSCFNGAAPFSGHAICMLRVFKTELRFVGGGQLLSHRPIVVGGLGSGDSYADSISLPHGIPNNPSVMFLHRVIPTVNGNCEPPANTVCAAGIIKHDAIKSV